MIRIQPNAYWWMTAVIAAYVLGATGSFVMVYLLAGVSVLQLGFLYVDERRRSRE